MKIPLMLAVNNSNGFHTGHAEAIEFGDSDVAQFEADCTCSLPQFGPQGRFILLDGKLVVIESYMTYVGNLIWDCAFIDVATANELLEYMRITPEKFQLESGAHELWSTWEHGERADLAMILADVADLPEFQD